MAIYSYNKAYSIGYSIVRFFFRLSYRHLRYRGMDRLPKDAAILFMPNHCNALMDALAVLFLDERAKVFVSRADIFRNPHAARVLHFLRIMPIRRVRDGLNEVRRNDETIHESVETLRHGMPFCIMAEGTHHADRSILPLRKGGFRIALEAAHQMRDERPVFIVPVRLEFADLYHLWDTLEVTVGEPLLVPYDAETPDPVTINHLLEQQTDRMTHQLLTCGPIRPARRPLRLLWLTPLALLCALPTLPIWLGEMLIHRCVEDECFYTSVLFVWQMLWFVLSLGTLILPWLAIQEFRYQIRKE